MATAPHHSNRVRRQGRGEKTPAEKLRGFYVHLIVYVCVNVDLVVFNFRRNPDHLWFYWVAMGWGIGIVFHALRAFLLTSYASPNRPTRESETPPHSPPTL